MRRGTLFQTKADWPVTYRNDRRTARCNTGSRDMEGCRSGRDASGAIGNLLTLLQSPDQFAQFLVQRHNRPRSPRPRPDVSNFVIRLVVPSRHRAVLLL